MAGVETLEVDDSASKTSPLEWGVFGMAILFKIAGRALILGGIVSVGMLSLWKNCVAIGAGIICFFFGAGLERLVGTREYHDAVQDGSPHQHSRMQISNPWSDQNIDAD